MGQRLASLLLAVGPALVQAAPLSLSCSTTQGGKGAINEVQTQDSFIEIYFLAAADLANWSLWIAGSGPAPVQIALGQGQCRANASTTPDNASGGASATTWPAGTFIACDSPVTIPSKGEILLVDKQTALASGNATVIDALNYGNPPRDEWRVDAACRSVYDAHSAAHKDIARVPDGTGALRDNDDESTKGCSNTACTPVPATPGGFNAVDVGQDAIAGVIKTKIAGQAFSLEVHALNGAGTHTLPSYTGTLALYLVDGSTNAICGAMTVVQSLGSHTYTGAGAGKDNGVTTRTLTYADAAPNLRVKMVDSSAGVTACSTDAFAVRPASLAYEGSAGSLVVATDADWENAGTSRALANSGASGGILHKAGRPFSVRARAWSASGVATPGYSGIPGLSLVDCVLPGSGCISGTLSAGTLGNSSGLVSTSTATYSEVGAITAQLSDSSFAAIDAGDGSTLAERTVASGNFTIGRFVPDHFSLGANTPVFAPGCGTFTYLGQPFGFSVPPLWTATAENAANATTRNYTGSLFKLSAAGVTGQAWSASAGSVSPVGALPDPVVTDLGGGLASLAFAVGDPASGAGLAFARSLTAPFSATLGLVASVADSEAVAYGGNPYTQAGIGFSGGHDRQMLGRLRISNAYGSERLALPVPLAAQSWDGQGFAANTLDNCTALAAPSLTFYPQSASNQLASGETGASYNLPLIAGAGNLRLSAPGVGNHGFLDLSYAAPAWLKYNWDGTDAGGDGDLLDDNPRARASFGQRNNASRVIIRREIY